MSDDVNAGAQGATQEPETDANGVPKSVKFTYPDGCEVYGVPPFPALSPKEVAAAELRAQTPAQDTFARQQAEIEARELAARQQREAALAAMVTGAQVQTSGGTPAGTATDSANAPADGGESPTPGA